MCNNHLTKAAKSGEKFSRLSGNIVPSTYDICLKPNLETFRFDGECSIKLTVRDITDVIVLHCNELDIQSVSLKIDATGEVFDNLYVEYDNKWTMVAIRLNEHIHPGQITLTAKFVGHHNDKMQGFYRSAYKNQAGEEKFMVSSQFESTYARMAFPCLDEPNYKAVFNVSMEVDSKYTALSNMPVTSEANLGNGKKLVHFAPTPLMSTYLLFFGVGDFEFIEAFNKYGVKVRVYTLPGKAQQAGFALELTVKSLEWFGEWFGVPDVLPKVDIIAIPDFQMGAMENWGAASFREVLILNDPKQSSIRQRSQIALVVAHEMAHYWFGNLTTMAWFDGLWLKEGFASFMEYMFVGANYPEFDIWMHFANDEISAAFDLDSLRNSHPIEVAIGNPNELDEIYDHITYAKSNSVIRMLCHYLGESVFQAGLRKYVKDYAFKNTVTDNLWTCFSFASGQDIKALMSSWTQQMGYPLVSVRQEIHGDKRLLHLSQKRYIADGGKGEVDQVWNIPVFVSTASSKGQVMQKFLMTKPEETFTIDGVPESDWVKLNPGTIGFYRVEYADDMYNALLPAIADQTLPTLDRFGISSDTFAIVQNGKVDATKFLKLFEASIGEEDYVVRGVLDSGITSLINVMNHYQDKDAIGRVNKFIIKNMEPLYHKLGWDVKENENGQVSLLRALVISRLAKAGHPEIISTAIAKFNHHYATRELLDANLRATIYGIVGRNDGEAGFTKLSNIFETIGFPEIERNCIVAMACTTDFEVLKRVFDYGVSESKIRSQDIMLLFAGASSTAVGQGFLYDHFAHNIKNYVTIFGSVNSSLFQRCMKVAAEYQCKEENATIFEEFLKRDLDAASLLTLERCIKQTIEQIKLNSNLLSRNGERINKFLIDNNY
uniref:Aminopeptidase n=1 Tax=Rhabditophanes sp. KR3021 TaxID=114890 RepID=A0AC35U8K4_9BILA